MTKSNSIKQHNAYYKGAIKPAKEDLAVDLQNDEAFVFKFVPTEKGTTFGLRMISKIERSNSNPDEFKEMIQNLFFN